MDKYIVAPPNGSTNNGIGAADRKWQKGYFEKLPNWQEYLAESTGHGIVSGCEPTINGLTVTVGAGVVHLVDGTRKEIASTNITLDNADSTNPRIDLVYIDSTGTVAKITGTASASPSAPTLPSGGISVCNVSVAAGATTGTVTDSRSILPRYYNTGIVNVKDYGAKGDGVTDDTSAFESALLSAKNKILIVPNGNYKITRNLFADDVNDVIDNGSYTYIKPVYPKKEAFIKELNMLRYAGTVPYTGANAAAEYQQGFCVNRNTGNLLTAGVKGTSKSQTIYEVENDSLGTVLNSYSYSTLGHTNTITHCPELGKLIVADCTGAAYNYSIIDAETMVADPNQKTLPFAYYGMSWDPICKLFVGSIQNDTKSITLYICDINFTLLRTVTIPTPIDISTLNGGCCYDGVFFAPTFKALGEFSLLGKVIKLHEVEPWELEDCDVYDGKLYMAVGSLFGQCDVYICDGVAIYNDSITVKTFDRHIPAIATNQFNNLNNYIMPCEMLIEDGTQLTNMPFSWPAGVLKVIGDKSLSWVRQIIYRSNSNQIAVRNYANGSWGAWDLIVGTFGLSGQTISGDIRINGQYALDYGPTTYWDWDINVPPTRQKDGGIFTIKDKNNQDVCGLYVQTKNTGYIFQGFFSVNFANQKFKGVGLENSVSFTAFSPWIYNNQISLGTASSLWTQLYAATGTINTSDARLKEDISDVTDEVLDAWGEVNWCQFRFKDAVTEKGEEARIHNGLIAQRIKEVFESHSLDVTKYGLFCYDEWEAEDEEYDNEGNKVREAKPAGNCYALRYEECLAMEAAYQRRRADKLEERIKAIEEKMNLL